MAGFSDRTFWRGVEMLMLITAAAGLYIGTTGSDELLTMSSACLAVMTFAHYQHSRF